MGKLTLVIIEIAVLVSLLCLSSNVQSVVSTLVLVYLPQLHLRSYKGVSIRKVYDVTQILQNQHAVILAHREHVDSAYFI